MRHKKSVFRSLAMVTQLGLSVITPIFLCIFIGYQIDSRWGMKTLVPLLILGVFAGARCAWRLAMNTLEQECREERLLRKERESQTNRTGISKPKQASRILSEKTDEFSPIRGPVLASDEERAADGEADEGWNG